MGKIELKDISGHLLSYMGKMSILKVMNTIALGSNCLWWQDPSITGTE